MRCSRSRGEPRRTWRRSYPSWCSAVRRAYLRSNLLSFGTAEAVRTPLSCGSEASSGPMSEREKRSSRSTRSEQDESALNRKTSHRGTNGGQTASRRLSENCSRNSQAYFAAEDGNGRTASMDAEERLRMSGAPAGRGSAANRSVKKKHPKRTTHGRRSRDVSSD